MQKPNVDLYFYDMQEFAHLNWPGFCECPEQFWKWNQLERANLFK
jgi:hypothetical protein